MYTEYQLKILEKLTRYNVRQRYSFDEINPYHLIPQWFKEEKPLRGFARLPAPEMPTDLVIKCVTLFDFSLTVPNVYQHNIAGVVAALLVWEALFPESFQSCGEKITRFVESWDIEKEPISVELMDRWNDSKHPVRNSIFNMRCYDPYRIVTTRWLADEYVQSLKDKAGV